MTSRISDHLYGVLSLNCNGHPHVDDTLVCGVDCDALEMYESTEY
jgi:hypothetical protein